MDKEERTENAFLHCELYIAMDRVASDFGSNRIIELLAGNGVVDFEAFRRLEII